MGKVQKKCVSKRQMYRSALKEYNETIIRVNNVKQEILDDGNVQSMSSGEILESQSLDPAKLNQMYLIPNEENAESMAPTRSEGVSQTYSKVPDDLLRLNLRKWKDLSLVRYHIIN